MHSVSLIDSWPVDHAATAVVSASGEVLARHGELDRVFPLASVTKMITAYAALIAAEEEAIQLDEPAGPTGSTVRHLLAHASGLDFSSQKILADPGTRRIYSNTGFEVLAEAVAEHSGIGFNDYVREAVLEPLGMTATVFEGSPAAGARSTVADLARFAAELQRPRLLHSSTLDEATATAFPGLDGILPGFGRQSPNDWGLGFELRGRKSPHWMGSGNSPASFGHFGQTGTFLWVDPVARVACVALTDRAFGSWAAEIWPIYSDAVLDEFTTTVPQGTAAPQETQ